jgi:hypothetical protein
MWGEIFDRVEDIKGSVEGEHFSEPFHGIGGFYELMSRAGINICLRESYEQDGHYRDV